MERCFSRKKNQKAARFYAPLLLFISRMNGEWKMNDGKFSLKGSGDRKKRPGLGKPLLALSSSSSSFVKGKKGEEGE